MKTLALGCAATLVIAGCGDSEPKPPVGAVRPPDPPPATEKKTTWSKQDKIDAIQKSGMSPDQKKQAIAGINAGG
ncbi:hypothetical protein OP10G_0374 [Fimbriimonas ginsengisoli Gsoil 348]|uniref:Lipoprotein n=1 Tax=Fimbriimonas ginsengisoli Gsoil 348 TaxID=661478 RepID=A0A068NJW1_FIMGI|nr:hypothetical protein OP10G_0374 [Fimbriimonas ginsengisoli Gsoil 348]